MKEIVVISGKGGTGKTSITASFAALSKNAVLADCDVDAADLHLLLNPEIKARHEFRCGHEAVINAEKCMACGMCAEVCRFDAVRSLAGKMAIDPFSCEGCGVCVQFCKSDAVDFPERLCGEWYESETRYGPMVHARLLPGAENSGKLVAQVRKAARERAENDGRELIIVDGPPGVGCPVIASITGASAVLAVTEPTVSGEHDLERLLKLAAHFKIPTMACVNKWDLNPAMTARIESKAIALECCMAGRIPYDKIFTKAMLNGQTVAEYKESAAAVRIKEIWEFICRKV